jgi:galactonate dehydratase
VRIAALRTAVVGTPWRNLTLVELRTDEGLTGVGEVRMLGHTDALLGYLAEAESRHILGADPFAIEALVQRMYRGDYARAGEIAMSAIACVEVACWDIVGQALGQPVHRLLGGAVRERIPAYANGWYTVEREPEEFAAAARSVVEGGYRALKLDPFGAGHLELDRDERLRSVALVEAVREAVGPDVDVLVEMHGRFTPAVAIALARDLEPFAPVWIEEPVPPENLRALAKVAARVNIPVATGERLHTRYDFRELFELQAADVIQPDITHLGGLWESRRRRRRATSSSRRTTWAARSPPPRTCTSPRARRTSRSRSTSTTSPTRGSATSRRACPRWATTAASPCRPGRASACASTGTRSPPTRARTCTST